MAVAPVNTQSAFDFAGQRALVTGASRGIGAVVAGRLAALGAHVFVNFNRHEEAARATCSAILAHGGSAEAIGANLVEPAAIRGLVTRIGASGPLDMIVHCAALGSFKPTIDLKPPQWDLTLAVNTRSLLIAAQAALPLMEGRDGRIVSLSSLGSARVLPSYGAIGVSKAAMESLTRYLACELAPKRIRVNAVAAGLIDGSSISTHPSFDAMRAATLQRTPVGRLGRPDDVADAVIFLCSRLATWITGQTLVVDGGFSLLA
jgi:enoyl-[acyl-carrier protein] reductase III